MEQSNQPTNFERFRNSSRRRRHSNDSVATGLFLLLIGCGLLMGKMFPQIPGWIFSWKTFLIALGFYLGYKNNFRLGPWIAPIIVGIVFIVKQNFYGLPIAHFIWPIAIIVVGVALIVRPRFSKSNNGLSNPTAPNEPAPNMDADHDATWSAEDIVESTNIFSGSKKINLSKNFKGGEIVNVFGGSELNLTKCDIKGRAVLEVTCIFGGAKLVIPADWSIQQEAVAIFGGIDDKRPILEMPENPSKVLVLRGTVLMGGIDIRSY